MTCSDVPDLIPMNSWGENTMKGVFENKDHETLKKMLGLPWRLNPNSKFASPCNDSLLEVAMKELWTDGFRTLLQAGADPRARVCRGHRNVLTAIANADAHSWMMDIAKYALNISIEIVEKIIWKGYIDCLQIVLDRGFDVRSRSKNGYPLACWLPRNNNPEIVKMVLAAGIDVNARNTSGITILFSATYRSAEIIYILAKAGVNPNIASTDLLKQTPLNYGVRNHFIANGLKIVRALLDIGCDRFIPYVLNSGDIAGAEYSESKATVIRLLHEWPRVVTLRMLCIRAIDQNQVDTTSFPSALLNYPDELEEKRALEQIECNQRAYRKRKREEENSNSTQNSRQK